MIEIKQSNVHGNGVFATQDLLKDTILECRVFLLKKDQVPEELKIYRYPWDGVHNSFCIGFGWFFNASPRPNVTIDSIDKVKLIKRFRLLLDVKAGQELFLKYPTN